MVSFSDFSKIDIRVGKVLSVEDHPDADKLYVLRVDIGEKEIQLVAGVKNYYAADELMGKNIVVLANLEPRTLRGVESQGMLLAAQSEDTISVLSPDREMPPGSKVR
ncbi:MAG: methionine--tRNA ligase subunit beta [Candidatus Omnitrophica bacterium 4484_171]|nr:MAG: methionine--tRNA ligase subunit beta [Candidatus Omnitrophica bacterium 4484_171]